MNLGVRWDTGEGAKVKANRCPGCGSPIIEVGDRTKDGYREPFLKFTPSWRSFAFFRWNKGVDLDLNPSPRCSACPSCGLMWSRVDPQQLRRYIERYGTSEAKLALARLTKPEGQDELA